MKRVRTRIIATLGPASARSAVLRQMAEAGLDVVRLNFSHGTHRSHEAAIRMIRALNRSRRRRIRILQDLEGPRIRIGKLPSGPISLTPRKRFRLFQGDGAAGDAAAPIDYEGPLSSMRGATEIFIDDGTIVLKVLRVERRSVLTEVVIGGTLKEHKGLNIPSARLEFPLLGEKDREDLAFGLSHGVDVVAQSFVRNAAEIAAVASIVRRGKNPPLVIAKIEEAEGVRNLQEILDAADGIMVARGDMGVSLPVWEVPIVQKEIIRKARRRGKLTIVATQMLESMTTNRRPTRAEAADVANAVLDGADFVMLSGETAVGRHPAEAVRMMNRICAYTETHATFA